MPITHTELFPLHNTQYDLTVVCLCTCMLQHTELFGNNHHTLMSLLYGTVHPVCIEVIQLEKSLVLPQPCFRQEKNTTGANVMIVSNHTLFWWQTANVVDDSQRVCVIGWCEVELCPSLLIGNFSLFLTRIFAQTFSKNKVHKREQQKETQQVSKFQCPT